MRKPHFLMLILESLPSCPSRPKGERFVTAMKKEWSAACPCCTGPYVGTLFAIQARSFECLPKEKFPRKKYEMEGSDIEKRKKKKNWFFTKLL